MEAEGLQRRRIAIEFAANGDFIDSGCAEIDGDFRAAQRDLGQFLQALLLVAFDDRLRREMADSREHGHARGNGRNG